MKRCIVFDVDRTIVDSYMPELLSLQEAIENITGKKINEEEMNKLTSLTTTNFFKYLKLSDNEISLVNKEWDKTFNKYKINCFPKIKEIIRELFNSGFIIAIITSRTMEEFHELDDELGDILDTFKIIITSDLIKNPKPDPEGIVYLCNELQLTREEVIYIGDSEIDKIFSQNCNIDFIPACWENIELEKENEVCLNIEKLNDIINKYNSNTSDKRR